MAFAHTPVEGDVFYTDDPIELLVTHELAHVFHLDEARGGWRVLRGVFGRGEFTFPHVFDGSYLIEGLATFYESRLTDGGRVRGTRFSEILRARLLETKGPKLDEAESDPGAWPLDRHYAFGSLFLEHLAGRYGVDTTPTWMARRAGSFRSIFSRGAGVGDLFGGRSLTQEWDDWIAAERGEAVRLRDRLQATAPGLAITTRLCDVAHSTSFPRISPDGSAVAFLATDEGRAPPGLYVADLQACEPRRIARVDGSQAFAWAPDGRSIVFSQLTLVDNARLFSDLFRVEIASGDVTRLTRAARLASPDVHPSGRTIVAVQYDHDRSRLVTVAVDSGTIAPLTEFSAETRVGTSPLVTRWHAARRGAIHPGGLVRSRAALRGGAPAVSADGRSGPRGGPEWDASAPAGRSRLFFTSDRTGVRELYGLELDGDGPPRLYLTARVPTGLHEVTVVPARQGSRDASLPGPASGRTTIVATVTHADGRHLERLEIDRAAWVAAPAPIAEYAQRPGGPDPSPVSPEPTAPRGYSPARDLLPTGWSPVLETMEELGGFCRRMRRMESMSSAGTAGRGVWRTVPTGGQSDPRATSIAGFLVRTCSARSLRPGGSSSASNPGTANCCAWSGNGPPPSASSFPGQTLRRRTLLSANLEIEDRHRENRGDAAARRPAIRSGRNRHWSAEAWD